MLTTLSDFCISYSTAPGLAGINGDMSRIPAIIYAPATSLDGKVLVDAILAQAESSGLAQELPHSWADQATWRDWSERSSWTLWDITVKPTRLILSFVDRTLVTSAPTPDFDDLLGGRHLPGLHHQRIVIEAPPRFLIDFTIPPLPRQPACSVRYSFVRSYEPGRPTLDKGRLKITECAEGSSEHRLTLTTLLPRLPDSQP